MKIAITKKNTVVTILLFFILNTRAQITTQEPSGIAVGTWQTVRGGSKLDGIQRMKGGFSAAPVVKWKAQLTGPRGGGEGEPVVGDVNGDGLNDIVMVEGTKLWVLNGTTGAVIWTRTGVCNQSSVAIGDVNNDGIIDILSLNDKAYLLNGSTGATIWSWTPPPAPNTGGAVPFAPTSFIGSCPNIGDLDKDGIPEAIILVNDGVYILNGISGTTKWQYVTGKPCGVSGYNSSAPAIGDLNKDGYLDVVANLMNGDGSGFWNGKGGALVALSGNGGVLLWSKAGPTEFGLGSPFPSIGDVDGDCNEDVIIGAGAVRGLDGLKIWGDPSKAGGSAYNTIVDLNHDSHMEIITRCSVLKGIDGSLIWKKDSTRCSSGWYAPAPRVGDFNPASPGDEIIFASAYQVQGSAPVPNPIPIEMYSGFAGTLLWSYDIATLLNHTSEGISVADVDNDGCVEIIIAPDCCYGDPTLLVLDDVPNLGNCGVVPANNASFIASKTNPCVNSCINFTDLSFGASAWTWSFPGGTPSSSTDQNPSNICFNTVGTYTVSLISTFGNCKKDTAYLPITITCSDLGVNVNTASVCPGACANLTASPSNGTAPYTYSWSPGGETSSVISVCPASMKSYTVTITDFTGATASEIATVNVNNAPNATIAGIKTICKGTSTTLSAKGPGTYSWSTGQTTSGITVTPVSGTSYSVTITSLNGCISTASEQVAVGNNFTTTITGDSAYCEGDSATLTATGGGTYAWTGGFTTPTINVMVDPNLLTNSETFTVTVINTGCTSTASWQVTVKPVPGAPVISQNGNKLTSSYAIGNQWYLNGVAIPGAIYRSDTATIDGNYTVVVTIDGCISAPSLPVKIINTGIDESNKYAFNIYPNPNDGNFVVSFNALVKSDYTIELKNVLGQLVFKETLVNYSGTYSKKLSVVEYGKGIYTISLTNAKNETIKKIMVY